MPGLNQFEGKHPPVAPVFYAFRVMVGMGMAMLAISWLGSFYLWRRGTLPKLVMWGLVAMTFSGWIATLAGWYVTEIGRQPWLVTGVLTTAQAASAVPAAMIGTSLAMYLAIYVVLLLVPISRCCSTSRAKATVRCSARCPRLRRACNRRSDGHGAHHRQSSSDLRRLMAVSILAYVILDGYDLGVGMLMARGNRAERDRMISTIGPFWDANETWLVLGIGLLLVAFPAAHGLILTQLYLPVALMLLGLTLRGVAFEFRVKAQLRYQGAWDWAFVGGSLLTALTQGYMLGRYIMGFQPGFWPESSRLPPVWPAASYAFVGSTWLLAKTEGELQARAVGWAQATLLLTLVSMIAVSIATPLVSPRIFERWFSFPNIIGLAPIP